MWVLTIFWDHWDAFRYGEIGVKDNTSFRGVGRSKKVGGQDFRYTYMFWYGKFVVKAQAEDLKRRKIENCSLFDRIS